MVDIVEKLTDFFQDIGDINARTMDMLKNRNMQICLSRGLGDVYKRQNSYNNYFCNIFFNISINLYKNNTP